MSNLGFNFLSSSKWLLYDSSILFFILFNIAISTLKIAVTSTSSVFSACSFCSGCWAWAWICSCSFSLVSIFSTIFSISFIFSTISLSSFDLYVLIIFVKSSLVIKFLFLIWMKLLSSFTIELIIDNSLFVISAFSFSFIAFSGLFTFWIIVLIKSGSSWIILSTLYVFLVKLLYIVEIFLLFCTFIFSSLYISWIAFSKSILFNKYLTADAYLVWAAKVSKFKSISFCGVCLKSSAINSVILSYICEAFSKLWARILNICSYKESVFGYPFSFDIFIKDNIFKKVSSLLVNISLSLTDFKIFSKIEYNISNWANNLFCS